MNIRKDIILKKIAPVMTSAVLLGALYGHAVSAGTNRIDSSSVQLGDTIVMSYGYYENDTRIDVPTKTEVIDRGDISADDIVHGGVLTGNASVNDVLEGKTFTSNTAGAVAVGTMPNHEGEPVAGGTPTIVDGKLYTAIGSPGYYSTGSHIVTDVGSVTRNMVVAGETFTSSAGVKTTGTMNNKSNTTQLVSHEGAQKGAMINSGLLRVKIPVTGYYSADNSYLTVDVGSVAAQYVLTGQTFTSTAAGVHATGTMPDKRTTQVASSPTINNALLRVTMPTGYYEINNSYLTVDVGTATTGEVLSGKTFTSTSGIKISGQMANQGAVSTTIDPGATYTIPAGYHNGSGKVTARYNKGTKYTTTASDASNYSNIDMGANSSNRYIDATTIFNAGKAQGATTHTGTYTASSRSSSLDMGTTHSYRYVDTSSVPNDNTEPYSFAVGSKGDTVDLGATNKVKTVNATNVYNKGYEDGKNNVLDNPNANGLYTSTQLPSGFKGVSAWSAYVASGSGEANQVMAINCPICGQTCQAVAASSVEAGRYMALSAWWEHAKSAH